MPIRITFPDALTVRVRAMAGAADHAGEVMPELERLMLEDNRDGLLLGQDRDGVPMAPLAARTIRYRRSAMGKADPNAPPLIPARAKSRAISRYRVTSRRRADGQWVMLGAWMDFVTKRDAPILLFHADGSARLPVRDILGVRPAGRARISAALTAWLRSKWSTP